MLVMNVLTNMHAHGTKYVTQLPTMHTAQNTNMHAQRTKYVTQPPNPGRRVQAKESSCTPPVCGASLICISLQAHRPHPPPPVLTHTPDTAQSTLER
jgi:hypothetical protein